MLDFRIDEERCIQCGECVLECPAGVIAMDAYPEMTNEAGCFQCQHCLAVCPTAAVSILGKDPDASAELKGNLPDPAHLATLIKGRRAVLRYRDKDLAPELIDHLLEVSCHAPVASLYVHPDGTSGPTGFGYVVPPVGAVSSPPSPSIFIRSCHVWASAFPA